MKECKFCSSKAVPLNVWFIHTANYCVPEWNERRTSIVNDQIVKSYSGPFYVCTGCEHRITELQPKSIETIGYRRTDEDVFGTRKYISYLIKKEISLHEIEEKLHRFYGIPNHRQLIHYKPISIKQVKKNDLLPILRKLGVKGNERPPTELGDILMDLYKSL